MDEPQQDGSSGGDNSDVNVVELTDDTEPATDTDAAAASAAASALPENGSAVMGSALLGATKVGGNAPGTGGGSNKNNCNIHRGWPGNDIMDGNKKVAALADLEDDDILYISEDDDDCGVDALMRKYKSGNTPTKKRPHSSEDNGAATIAKAASASPAAPSSSMDLDLDVTMMMGTNQLLSEVAAEAAAEAAAELAMTEQQPPLKKSRAEPVSHMDALPLLGDGYDNNATLAVGSALDAMQLPGNNDFSGNVDMGGDGGMEEEDLKENNRSQATSTLNLAQPAVYDPILELPDRAKQFLFSVGITTTEQLLARKPIDIKPLYVEWRKEQNLSVVTDTTIHASIHDWKDKVRRSAKMEMADNPLDFLPPQGQKLLAFMEIKTPEAFLDCDTVYLARSYVAWREREKMPALASVGAAESYVGQWKAMIRRGLRVKEKAAASTPNNGSLGASTTSANESESSFVTAMTTDPFPTLTETPKLFLREVGITTPRALLTYPYQDLMTKYAEWRKSKNLNMLTDSSVRNSINQWKTNLKRSINMGTATNPLTCLPPICQKFLDSIGIGTVEEFVTTETKILIEDYIKWREEEKLPALSEKTNGAEGNIVAWKRMVRQGIHAKDSTIQPTAVPISARAPVQKDPFDTLAIRPKEFLQSIGVTNAQELLSRSHKDLVSLYIAWRQEEDLPVLTEKSVNNSVATWRTSVRRTIRMATAADPFDVLPPNCRKFLSSLGISTPEAFFDISNKDMVEHYVKWRENENKTPLSSTNGAEVLIIDWKAMLRRGLAAKASVESNDDGGSQFPLVPTYTGVGEDQAVHDLLDTLPSQCKQFLLSVGISSAQQFLSRPLKELVASYSAWRKKENLACWLTESGAEGALNHWRMDIRRTIKMANSTNLLTCLPDNCQRFLSSSGINTAQEFVEKETKVLVGLYVQWREKENMNALSEKSNVAESAVYSWKKTAERGLQVKASPAAMAAAVAIEVTSEPASPVASIDVTVSNESGEYDPMRNLGALATQFLPSIGISTSQQLLARRNKELISLYQAWRRENHKAKLTEKSADWTVAQWKTKVRRTMKMGNASSDPLSFLPPQGKEFLGSIGITTGRQLLDVASKSLVADYKSWRETQNMPAISASAYEKIISEWKAMVRAGLQVKASQSSSSFSSSAVNVTFDPFSDAADMLETSMTSATTQSAPVVKNARGMEQSNPFSMLLRVDQQFLSSVGVCDADGFLTRGNDELSAALKEWRNELGLPELANPASYITDLKKTVQIRKKREEIVSQCFPQPQVHRRKKQTAAKTVSSQSVSRQWQTFDAHQRSRRTPSKSLSPPHCRGKQTAAKTISRQRMQQPVQSVYVDDSNDDEVQILESPAVGAALPSTQTQQRPQPQVRSSLVGGPNCGVPPMAMDQQLANQQACQFPQENLFDLNVPVEEAMKKVDGSTRTYVDSSTNRPVLEFAVHDMQRKGVIHDFRVHAAPSSIRGAGLGAFLTFLGSRQTEGAEIKNMGSNFVLLPGRYIDLGKYGPCQESDRKIWEHYELKNFLFCHEPSEWAWEVDLPGRTHQQAVDITDDSTGMIHALAKHSTLVYVNETGGAPYLTPNIFSRQEDSPDGRNIHYRFESQAPINKGQMVELLINYQGHYEEVRERKGYGKRNKSGETKSDVHLPSRFERNFVERNDLRHILLPLGTKRLNSLIKFLVGIRDQLAVVVETFLDHLKTSSHKRYVPYAQQLVALRRLHWLLPLIVKHFERVKKAGATTPETLESFDMNVNRLDWPHWATLWDALVKNPGLRDKRGDSLLERFREETMEEVFYSMRLTLPFPMDESAWCNVGIRLIRDLCVAVAERGLSESSDEDDTLLFKYFKSRTVEAANEIVNRTSVNDLTFDANVWKRYTMDNRISVKNESPGTKCVLAQENPNSPMPEPIILSPFQPPGDVKIHQSWYLCRQVVVVLDAFARSHPTPEKAYTVTLDVMKELGIDSATINTFTFSIAIGHDDQAYTKSRPFSKAEMQNCLNGWRRELDPSWPENEARSETETAVSTQPNSNAVAAVNNTPHHGAMPVATGLAAAVTVGMANGYLKHQQSLATASQGLPLNASFNGLPVGTYGASTHPLQYATNGKKENTNDSIRKAKKRRSSGSMEPPPGITIGEHHPPTEDLEGGWPEGWTRILVQRINSNTATAGRLDRYWVTPTERFKLRSLVEVQRFLAALTECNGDEKEAKKRMAKTPSRVKKQENGSVFPVAAPHALADAPANAPEAAAVTDPKPSDVTFTNVEDSASGTSENAPPVAASQASSLEASQHTKETPLQEAIPTEAAAAMEATEPTTIDEAAAACAAAAASLDVDEATVEEPTQGALEEASTAPAVDGTVDPEFMDIADEVDHILATEGSPSTRRAQVAAEETQPVNAPVDGFVLQL